MLLLSPTAAGPLRHAHERRALTVAPTQPNTVSTTAGDCAGYRHTGRTLRTPLEAHARGSATRRPATCRGRRGCAQSRQYKPSECVSTGPTYPHGKTWLPLSQTCLPPREGARFTAIRGLPARPTLTLRSITRARALLSHAWAVSSCAPCTPQGDAGATMAHRERARGWIGSVVVRTLPPLLPPPCSNPVGSSALLLVGLVHLQAAH